MAKLEDHIDLLERLLDYMIRGYRPFDTEAAIKTILRAVIVIGKEVGQLKNLDASKPGDK